MIRPIWEPKTDEERAVLAEAARLRKVAEEAEAAIWTNLARGRQLNIPDTTLCDVSGESRATLNRRFGSKKASE
ncbi:hypothetical protein ACFFX1_55465 [Dactylosporangium sucinum]|nr:hypothetical protein [Dactylosporangium sucinum]